MVGIYIKTVGLADLTNFFGCGFQIQFSVKAQHDVFRSGQHIDQFEVLMDHADAMAEGILRRTDNHLFVIDEDIAFIGIVNAGKHIHQSCLTAAVFTQQSENLSLIDVQPNLVIGQNSSKGFGDVSHFYRSNFCLQSHHPPVFI